MASVQYSARSVKSDIEENDYDVVPEYYERDKVFSDGKFNRFARLQLSFSRDLNGNKPPGRTLLSMYYGSDLRCHPSFQIPRVVKIILS